MGWGNVIQRLQRDTNLWTIVTLVLVLFIAFPIGAVFINLFAGPGETWDHVVTYLLPNYITNSVSIAIGCSVLTLSIGVTSAWIVSRYEFPYRKTLEWLLIVPLAIPSYITAYAYAGIFDYGGSLTILARFFDRTRDGKLDIMNIYGLIMILSLSLYPYVYVSARAVFLTQMSNLIEASKVLGVSEFKTFFKVVLPLGRPAIIGGLILVIMEVLNDYGAAKYYGVSTFTTGIFRSWFALEEPETAIYLSAILMVLVFGLMSIERIQRRKKGYQNDSKNTTTVSRKRLSKLQQYGLCIGVGIPVFLGFIIPVGQLIYWVILTLEDTVFTSFITVALQSLGIAAAAAFGTVIIVILLIYSTRWSVLKPIQRVSRISILGYAIPGAVIAVGVMIPTLALDKWLNRSLKTMFSLNIGLLINGTVIGLMYAYMVRFLAVAYNPVESNAIKIGSRISESSLLLGVNRWRTFFKIDLPLIQKGVWSGMLLVFVDIMKELPLTLILKPYGVTTLAVKAYEYASDEMIAEAALPSLCIILTGILPVIFLNRLITK